MKLLVDGDRWDGGLARTESRRLEELRLRREWAEPDAASRGPHPPTGGGGALKSPWTTGGGNRGRLPVPLELVPEREKYNGCEDQGAELASQRVVKVDRDGGERCRAECHDEDRDQGTKGRFWVLFLFRRRIS